ncbi:hypothetical protein D3C73_1478930 [compost metagenome]
MNLADQHFEPDLVLPLLHKILLMICFLNFLHKVMHTSDERIELLGQQTDFIFTVDMNIRFPRSRSHLGHMLA